MYIVVTNVDAKTKQACTVAPMLNGPAYPPLNNLVVDWSNQSKWPIATDKSGVYLTAPEYYGTCSDNSFTGFPGVLEVIDEAAFIERKRTEFHARKHFASWIFNEETLSWDPPVPYPTEGKHYYWDGPTVSWIEYPELATFPPI